jgi:integrase
MTKPYRLCSCRAPATTDPATGRKTPGRLLGKSCPKLKSNSRHGRWYARFEAPADASGSRRQPRIGPFDTAEEADEALTKARGQVHAGTLAADRKLTVAAYLARWLEDVRPELKPRTWASYEEAVRLYFGPGLGHVKLADLRDHHVRQLYGSMRKINRPEADGDGDETLRRLLAARAVVPHLPGRLIGTKPVSEAGIKRRHAVLVAALTDAVERRLIPASPASAIKFKIRKTKPLLWTEARSAQWAKDVERPAPVMVWRREQCGAFLDEAQPDRLFPLFHVVTHWGLRRQELANMLWSDVDLSTRRIHIRGDVKSQDSDRSFIIDPGTAGVLETWREKQLFEALEWGEAWTDTGHVFSRENGQPLRPAFISEHFKVIYRQAGLPPVRFHDLRHGAATMLRAAGVPIKTISSILGHSDVHFTDNTYVEVADEMFEDAAAAQVDLVPRKSAAA